MGANAINQSRRAALFGGGAARLHAIRPPWTDEDRIADSCTRCGDCIDACPEGVLVAGQGGFPAFDPLQGSGVCTFCRACAEACAAPVFDLGRTVPWSTRIDIDTASCLAHAGIHCSSCNDACDDDAIGMKPRIGGPPLPQLADAACTGCGACVGVCPGRAISLLEAQSNRSAA